MLQVAPRDTVVTAQDVEMVPNASGIGLSNQLAHSSVGAPGKSHPEPPVPVGPSAVALDMESPDVRAERERVSAMTSFENKCIVMQDLRKVYPPQVIWPTCCHWLQAASKTKIQLLKLTAQCMWPFHPCLQQPGPPLLPRPPNTCCACLDKRTVCKLQFRLSLSIAG